MPVAHDSITNATSVILFITEAVWAHTEKLHIYVFYTVQSSLFTSQSSYWWFALQHGGKSYVIEACTKGTGSSALMIHANVSIFLLKLFFIDAVCS